MGKNIKQDIMHKKVQNKLRKKLTIVAELGHANLQQIQINRTTPNLESGCHRNVEIYMS